MDIFGQNGCNRAIEAVLGQKRLCSGKVVVVFEQSDGNRPKLVVVGQK